nr:retrovirus-related Pol polyprotein from transposon TNT 1-94 [Tanacetum cinerariifolium]
MHSLRLVPLLLSSQSYLSQKNKGLVAKTFDWDEVKVSNDKDMTQVKVLMALADDELSVGKNHSCNDEWIDITMTKDRWSRDQHIKIVNIIGDPGEGMLTKSMAAKLTAASASECLFTEFLYEIVTKKVSEELNVTLHKFQ